MDSFLYVAMSGAKETLRAQTANSHNLANASTTGFRADLSAFQSRAGRRARAMRRASYATNSTIGWDRVAGRADVHRPRSRRRRSRAPGWIAVQGPDGREAYTRARRSARRSRADMLMNGAGQPVLGEGGPISVPPNTSLPIAPDGTISIVPRGPGAGDDVAGRPHQAREPAGRDAGARRRRPVPHDRRQRCRGRMRTCASPPACSSRAT